MKFAFQADLQNFLSQQLGAEVPEIAVELCPEGFDGDVTVSCFPLAKALHRRVTAVASAGEEIALADGKIRIPAGAIDAGISVKRESGFAFSAEVTGSGTLSIYIGDMETPRRTLTAADGETELRFRVAPGTTALRFAYAPGASDAGGASIDAFVGTNGFMLIIR